MEPTSKRSSMQKNGLILGAFAVVATLLVIGTEWLTSDRIQQQQQQELQRNLNQVILPASYDNDLFAHCIQINEPGLGGEQPKHVYFAMQQGQFTAAAMEVTAPNGYSGAIQLLVAVNADGSVAGVRVLEHQETPGLGDKIERRKNDWIDSFTGMQVNGVEDDRWAVQRDGGAFDQFTGATITPRAVVQAVKQAVLLFTEQHEQWLEQPKNCGDPS